MLSKKWNVPILFLNTAWAAADSENYRDGAMGKDAYNMYVGKNWPNRQPYTNLKNTLRYFHSWLGIRAVLWAHGENDAQHGVTENSYFENIKTLIDKSRNDAGFIAPWILARSSAGEAYPKPYPPIIQAQNRMFKIKNYAVYRGPDLDTVQMPRPKHGHFENISGGIQGLTLAAQSWNRMLTDSLLETMGSLQAKYTIHTGVVPSKVKPGVPFFLPFHLNGISSGTIPLQAELLNEHHEFVDTVGKGNLSPMRILIPETIKTGKYTIRITSSQPIIPGSVSTTMDVITLADGHQYINHIEARKMDTYVQVSWLMSVYPSLKKMTLQKTMDGIAYTDVATFEPVQNAFNSRIYTFTDANDNNPTRFYRLKTEDVEGQASFSPIATVFEANSLPPFIAFPNPVSDQLFYLRSETEQPILDCRLYNIYGKEHPISTNSNEMSGAIAVRPTTFLPSGLYILLIKTPTGSTSQTIVFK